MRTTSYIPGLVAATALALCATTSLGQPATACLYVVPGDMDENGHTSIDDVVCSALITLWALQGDPNAPVPDCATMDHKAGDPNCDGKHVLTDPALVTAIALGEALPPEIDANQDGCPDLCEVVIDPSATCAAACGGISGTGCWCDALCVSAGDCCPDACALCGHCPAPGGGGSGGSGGNGGSGPWCGDGQCSGGESCSSCTVDCGQCAPGDNCCSSASGPGCPDQTCEAAICGADPFCCNSQWDSICASAALSQCATCGATPPVCGDSKCSQSETCGTCPEDCGDCPFCGDGTCDWDENCVNCAQDCGDCPPAGSCCASQPQAGCSDAVCQETVCSFDPFCCNTQWDSICATSAKNSCEDCAGSGGELPPPPPPTVGGGCAGNCGSTSAGLCWCDSFCVTAGDCCADACEVCGWCANGGTQPFCGDGVCNGGENCALCPNDCGTCPSAGSCCAFSNTKGCDDPECMAYICALDSFCCNHSWDTICAAAAQTGCAVCEGSPPECGDGLCQQSENCSSCTQDCGECAFCGDGWCGAGENCLSCAADCGECGSSASCCEPSNGTGCSDPMCAAEVCALDAFCCQTQWDAICANSAVLSCGVCESQCGDGACAVNETCGGCPEDCGECPFCGDGVCAGWENCTACPTDCGQCPPGGDCCAASGQLGCNDAECTQTICAKDPFCCATQWDSLCANAAKLYCAACK